MVTRKILESLGFAVAEAENGEVALAKVLDRCSEDEVDNDPEPYVEPSTYTSCPACGKLSLRRSGGCNQCNSCGYSSC